MERVIGILAGVLSVGALGVTYVVGHSGAEAVWDGTFDQARQAPSTVVYGPITMADVAANSGPASCWTVVDGGVYDLTDFIARHPAGSGAVIDMCGTDASGSFNGAQSQPCEAGNLTRVGAR